MLKKIMIAALAAGVTTLVYAGEDSGTVSISEETESFIGLELGGAVIRGDTALELGHVGTGPSMGLRFGAQNELWRSMIVFDIGPDGDDDNQKYRRASLQVDYYPTMGTTGTKEFRPYIGLNSGYEQYVSDSVDTDGFTYGGQVGIVSAVSEDLDIDIGYRHTLATQDELDYVGNFVVGMNFMY